MSADVIAPTARQTHRQLALTGVIAAAAVIPLATIVFTRPGRGPGGVLGASAVAGALGAAALLPVLALALRRRRRTDPSSGRGSDSGGGNQGRQRFRRRGQDVAAPHPQVPEPVTTIGRAGLVAAADEALARRDLTGGQVAVLVLDVAEPDRVPALLGPTGPAHVARQALRRIRAWLPPQDTVAQLGPSSFAVVTEGLGGPGDPDGAPRVAARLAALLDEPMISGYRLADITFVIGIATSSSDLDTGEALLRAAQHARDDAGVTGIGLGSATGRARRTTWRHYDLAQHARALAEDTLRLELREALRDHRIHAVFRPIVGLVPPSAADASGGLDDDLATGAATDLDQWVTGWVAVRALPRWVREDGTAAPTDQLDRLTASTGLAAEVDLQVLDCGLDAVSAWYAAGFPVGRLAVRLCALNLRDPDLPAQVLGRLGRRDLPGTCLVIELDAAEAADPEALRPALLDLRAHGVEVVITGVVSPNAGMALLRTLPASGLSLHPAVIEAITRNPVPVAAAVAACHRAGARCLADGISSPEQLRAARRLRIDAISGALTGRPAGARDLSARFSQMATTTYS